jgi:chromosome segregation ATPase
MGGISVRNFDQEIEKLQVKINEISTNIKQMDETLGTSSLSPQKMRTLCARIKKARGRKENLMQELDALKREKTKNLEKERRPSRPYSQGRILCQGNDFTADEEASMVALGKIDFGDTHIQTSM